MDGVKATRRYAKSGFIKKKFIEECPFCRNIAPETIEHLLLGCSRWQALQPGILAQYVSIYRAQVATKPPLLPASISMRLVGKLLGKELIIKSTSICMDPTILCVKTTLEKVKFSNTIALPRYLMLVTRRYAKSGFIKKKFIEECPFCRNIAPETIEHLLLGCSRWQALQPGILAQYVSIYRAQVATKPPLLPASISMRLVGKLLGKELIIKSTSICMDPTILCVKTTLEKVKFSNTIALPRYLMLVTSRPERMGNGARDPQDRHGGRAQNGQNDFNAQDQGGGFDAGGGMGNNGAVVGGGISRVDDGGGMGNNGAVVGGGISRVDDGGDMGNNGVVVGHGISRVDDGGDMGNNGVVVGHGISRVDDGGDMGNNGVVVGHGISRVDDGGDMGNNGVVVGHGISRVDDGGDMDNLSIFITIQHQMTLIKVAIKGLVTKTIVPMMVYTAGRGIISAIGNFKRPDGEYGSETTPLKKYETHIPTTLPQKLAIALGSSILAVSEPTNGDYVAAVGDITSIPFLDRLRQLMLKDTNGRDILRRRPEIHFCESSFEALGKLENNTFGYHYYNYLTSLGISWKTRTATKFVDDAELAYIILRHRQIHDFYHVLLNRDISLLGEITIKYFEFVQTGLPVGLFATIVAPLRLNSEERSRLLTVDLPYAYNVAKSSKLLLNVDFEKYWNTPIDQMRKELGLYIQ
ncbi:hypothetical protein BB561_003311 [Smittium simulii]|uniref:4-hydroxy-3-methoxy-5-polyprenylbenzoate decarboxylase n=1 Tax=Smittium simulii TaxID=133385 RepID=A0A2T9YM05_9FUNG|nr:hypothetical protein BB561_003311 [Smittium simulii]